MEPKHPYKAMTWWIYLSISTLVSSTLHFKVLISIKYDTIVNNINSANIPIY